MRFDLSWHAQTALSLLIDLAIPFELPECVLAANISFGATTPLGYPGASGFRFLDIRPLGSEVRLFRPRLESLSGKRSARRLKSCKSLSVGFKLRRQTGGFFGISFVQRLLYLLQPIFQSRKGAYCVFVLLHQAVDNVAT